MYLYETHCHTDVVSKCSIFSPSQIVDCYVKNGYTGVFITDHFLNGNCHFYIRDSKLSFEKRISLFCEGYKQVKTLADDKLQVFFGFEYSYLGTDLLIYGWDERKLKSLPEIMELSMREFIYFAKANGALVVQAHPFREADYIDHIRLFPEVEGVEVYNACRDNRCNSLAEFYATQYNKYKLSGSDAHTNMLEKLGGMAFEEKLKDEYDFIERIRAGKGHIHRQENKLLW